jgi:hypothetical protein
MLESEMIRKSFRVFLLSCFSWVLLQSSVSFAYEVDSATNTVHLSPGTSPSATMSDVRNAVNYLTNRADKATLWTLKFAPGKYYLTGQINSSGLQNTLLSSDPNNPAQLMKMDGWNSSTSGEYLLNFRMCGKVYMTGFEFYGQTSFAASADPYWPDQGVYFGSCNVVRVESNKFFNIGNTALRVVTDARDPVMGVNSFKTTVINNTFNNIYQTSTTATDLNHGGTALSSWLNNTFVNLRGSVKFASRTPGGRGIEFINNVINGGDHFGLEINNYNDFKISGNIIQNIKSVAINVYTGAGINGFPWGDNFTISNNNIANVGRAIRYSHEPAVDGYQYVPSNLIIDNNTIKTVSETNSQVSAISIINGIINGVQVTNNKLSGIANKQYISIYPTCTNVSVLGNTVEGVAYDPQLKTASK